MSWETIGERGRNGADAEPTGQALVDLVEAVAQIFDLGENPMGVVQDDLSLRRQADIAMAALDDRRPKIVFEQPDRSRRVGWDTWQASAARPKCFSRASAARYSS